MHPKMQHDFSFLKSKPIPSMNAKTQENCYVNYLFVDFRKEKLEDTR